MVLSINSVALQNFADFIFLFDGRQRDLGEHVVEDIVPRMFRAGVLVDLEVVLDLVRIAASVLGFQQSWVVVYELGRVKLWGDCCRELPKYVDSSVNGFWAQKVHFTLTGLRPSHTSSIFSFSSSVPLTFSSNMTWSVCSKPPGSSSAKVAMVRWFCEVFQYWFNAELRENICNFVQFCTELV